MICFYHSADLDGHCSGAIVKMAYPECEMIGINYNDEFPWDKVKGEKVAMVDFSLQPFGEMVKLNEICDLVLIDHHKTTIEDYEKYYTNKLPSKPMIALLDVKKAGCELTWDYFNSKTQHCPSFVTLLGRYDVWDHSDVRVLPFQWGMRTFDNTYPENQTFWRDLFDIEQVHHIINIGRIVTKYRDSENSKFIKGFGFDVEFEGMRGIAVNKGMTNSQLFDSVWDESKYDLMIPFALKKGKWTVSLYTTKENIDCSAIAKKHGGGGHKRAAGFVCEKLPFLEMVKV